MTHLFRNDDDATFRIVFCVILAIGVHVLLFALLANPNLKPEKKTITFQLVSQKQLTFSKAAQLNNPSPNKTRQSHTLQSKKRILSSTAKKQPYKVIKVTRKETSKGKPRQKTQAKTISPPQRSYLYPAPQISTPQIPDLPSTPSINSPNIAGISNFSSYFLKKKHPQSTYTEISTKKHLKKMSIFELRLLQKFLNTGYYDKINTILLNSKQVQRITLKITLFPNGSIKNVTLSKPSTNPELNVAAINAALSASPYPNPPQKDKKKGFEYHINLEFKPL